MKPKVDLPRPLRHLLLTTTEDAFDVKAWSGIPHSLRVALQNQLERVTVFRPSPPRRNFIDVIKRIFLSARKHPLWITQATLRQNARELQAEIARTQPDAVLSISSQMVAYLLDPGVPVFLFSDAPYLAFAEVYARWETYPARLNAFAVEEAHSARRLNGLCFGSSWACSEATRLYGLDRAGECRLHVTPLGANWVPQLPRDVIFQHIDGRGFDHLELLFLGRDWERKRGPLALEVVRLLHEGGYKVRLHVVGCRPKIEQRLLIAGLVTVHGLLSRSDPAQCETLTGLFLNSHFLLMPSLAECFGIVFAEAQAFGLPPIACKVQAVPSVVVDEQGGATVDAPTGLLFDPAAPASEYVHRITTLIADPSRYRSMARRGRERFEKFLNWDFTAKSIVSVIQAVLLEENEGKASNQE